MSNDLYISAYNPDVLSCIANLSNDEVFTPPEVANAMLDLLPKELFCDPNTTFLDPACKSGVFLREIAKRLLAGLEPVIPDLQERIDHIFHQQLFALFQVSTSNNNTIIVAQAHRNIYILGFLGLFVINLHITAFAFCINAV